MQRKPYWFEINAVLPCVLIVCLSWASFFIARAAVPARVAMGIICYLTLSNLNNSIMGGLPKLSYNVRLVMLIRVSQYFVFYSIVEYAMAKCAAASSPPRCGWAPADGWSRKLWVSGPS